MRLLLTASALFLSAIGSAVAQGEVKGNATSADTSKTLSQTQLLNIQAPNVMESRTDGVRWPVIRRFNNKSESFAFFAKRNRCFLMRSYLYDQSAPPKPVGKQTCTDAKLNRLQPAQHGPIEKASEEEKK